MSDKDPLPKIYREHLTLDNEKAGNLIVTWAEDADRHLTREDMQTVSKYERCSSLGETQTKTVRSPPVGMAKTWAPTTPEADENTAPQERNKSAQRRGGQVQASAQTKHSYRRAHARWYSPKGAENVCPHLSLIHI